MGDEDLVSPIRYNDDHHDDRYEDGVVEVELWSEQAMQIDIDGHEVPWRDVFVDDEK